MGNLRHAMQDIRPLITRVEDQRKKMNVTAANMTIQASCISLSFAGNISALMSFGNLMSTSTLVVRGLLGVGQVSSLSFSAYAAVTAHFTVQELADLLGKLEKILGDLEIADTRMRNRQ